MSIEIQNLQRLAVTKESSANFATDLTGSATYLDVPAQEGSVSLTLTEDSLETQALQQYLDAYPLRVRGKRMAELSFTMPLHPTGTAAGDGGTSAAEDANALIQMLAVIMGGIDAANDGTTFATVTDEDTWTLTSGTGFTAGGAIGWTDSSSVFHARELVGNLGAAPKIALPSAPSVSDVAYAGTTLYLGDDPTDTLQFIVEGAEQDDRWLLLGGQATAAPTVSLALGEIPTITFTFSFADWESLGSAAITAASYSAYSPIANVGSFFRAQVAGTSTLQNLDISAIEWTLNAPVYQMVPSPSGTNTVARWRRSRAVPAAEVSITLPYESTTWWTERDDRDRYHLGYQIGSTAGECVLLTVPNGQVVDAQRVDGDGIASQQVTFVATVDGTIAGSRSEQRGSAFRIHVL